LSYLHQHDIIPSIVASKTPLFEDITTTQPNLMILSDELLAVLPVHIPVLPPTSIQPTTLNTPVWVVHSEIDLTNGTPPIDKQKSKATRKKKNAALTPN
jgi:hypothetical protein